MLLIYSGGMDSTVLLHEYKDQIKLAISFHYGSKHNDCEFKMAEKNCEKLGIPLKRIDIRPVMGLFTSSLLRGEVPEGHYADDNMRSTVVPFRNGIMLSIAAGIADSNGLSRVAIANHHGDAAQYPDCRNEFIEPMSMALYEGTHNNVTIFAPYTFMTKREIAEHGHAINVDFHDTYSCYKGGVVHCGRCGTCVERIWALKGFDPTVYQDKLFAINELTKTGEWNA
jgi:7-cyano-7-deazaguanine synthase